MKNILLALFVAVFALSGCGSGSKTAELGVVNEKDEKIVIGTPKEDVEKILGSQGLLVMDNTQYGIQIYTYEISYNETYEKSISCYIYYQQDQVHSLGFSVFSQNPDNKWSITDGTPFLTPLEEMLNTYKLDDTVLAFDSTDEANIIFGYTKDFKDVVYKQSLNEIPEEYAFYTGNYIFNAEDNLYIYTVASKIEEVEG